MKKMILAAGLATVTVLTGCNSTTFNNEKVVVKDAGLQLPECVIHYAMDDVYLVSNMNESHSAADDNGFISRVNPDGTIAELKWIDGADKDIVLHCPKGLAVVGELLFVGDLHYVQVFNVKSGKQVASIKIKGSTFLNDVCNAGDGSVYVTDSGISIKDGKLLETGADAIHQVWPNGKYKTIVKGKELGKPNGVALDADSMILASWGDGKMRRVARDGKYTMMPTPPKGKLDGLFKNNDGLWMVNSHDGDAIYTLGKDGKYTTFADKLGGPSDMAYDAKRNRLILAQADIHALQFLPLESDK